MVNFSIAVAVLLATPTPIDAFQLPRPRRNVVHYSSRGDYNNYREEYERGDAPRGDGFKQWDDPIRRDGYDGYDWQSQRENYIGDIDEIKCVALLMFTLMICSSHDVICILTQCSVLLLCFLFFPYSYRDDDSYSPQKNDFRSQQWQQRYNPSRDDWRNNRFDDRWYDGSNGNTGGRYISQPRRNNYGRSDKYERQSNAYWGERPQDFAYSNDYYERADDGPYNYQRQKNNNNDSFYNSRYNNDRYDNRNYNERNRQQRQGSRFGNYPQRKENCVDYPQRNENYASYPQRQNSQRDKDYYRENDNYPKQELIRNGDMSFPMMPSFPSIMPGFPSLFRNMFSGPIMPSFPSFFGDDMMMPSPDALPNVMQQAREQIANDEIVLQRMGGAIDEMICPFSQNVASNTFNGKRSTSVKAAFEVVGKNGRVGVATVEAIDDKIIALFVDLDGERIRLPLMRRRGGENGGGDVVDAEIID